MPHPQHHPQCPRCKGQGFYLRAHGRAIAFWKRHTIIAALEAMRPQGTK